jgi:hypothetical protein
VEAEQYAGHQQQPIVDFIAALSYIAASMIYDYAVTLKNNSRYADRFSLLLLFISIVIFMREQVINPYQVKIAWAAGSLIILAILGYNQYLLRKDHTRNVNYSRALLIAGIVWLTMPYLRWLCIPFILMALFERYAKLPVEIGFTNDVIVFNTLFRRRYPWSAFNNIVLKDDLLTLDFKDNRLMQRETVDEDGDAGEDEFNDYCQEQLARVHA